MIAEIVSARIPLAYTPTAFCSQTRAILAKPSDPRASARETDKFLGEVEVSRHRMPGRTTSQTDERS